MNNHLSFFTDFQSKLYDKYGYTMDKLNPTMNYWFYDRLSQRRTYREIGYHNYHVHYASRFNELRHKVKKILEIGVFRGHSMLMWQDYFPNAEIYGVDIEYTKHHLGVNAKELCKDQPRIHLYEYDACNPLNVRLLMDEIGSDFDIIIDDGSHHPTHQLFSLLYYTDYLKDDGVFVVEDVFMKELFEKEFLDYFNKPFNLYNDVKYFFDEVIQDKPKDISRYGIDSNKQERFLDIVNQWNIDIREPKPYVMNFKDIDLKGNNEQKHFNNRQAIIFFDKNKTI